MARRSDEEEGVSMAEERTRRREAGRTDAPRTRPRPGAPSRNAISPWKLGFRVAGALAVAGGLWYAQHRTSQFLIRDERFALPELGAPIVEGLRYTAKEKVMRVFAEDLGKSVYLLPLAQRRKSLVDVDWVRDASVARLWPNQVIVHITERKPLAFLAASSGAATRFELIDGDGIVLQQPPQARFTLPVLVGVRASDLLSVRRDRVHRLQQLVTDLGPRSEKISEVDVAEIGNLKVTMPAGSRMVTLFLGDQNFGQRMQNYLDHAAEIRKKVPNAKTVDLRIEDRITVVE
ncbi:MAG: FtsQ-type POTRA domain-containing protein [Bryobacteraceae bacterium]